MFRFREMEETDAHDVYKIEKNVFTDPWPYENFSKYPFENDHLFAYVACLEDQIIGYILGWHVDVEIHITNIAVKKQYQRQGVGTFLLRKLFSIYSDYKFCYLEVRESNLVAQKLYQKFGFIVEYVRKNYYSNGEDAILMSKYR
jgi:ribosomal-protein-alanine N-acetyltransferase